MPALDDPSTAPLLLMRDLACQRGGRRLFASLHLVVRPGDVVRVRGANGRGKTSLLRVAAGLAPPDDGQLAGRCSPARAREDLRARPLFIGHALALNPDLTAREALGFLARVQGDAPAPAALSDALAALGLPARWHHAPVRRLSQGQQRRVALARLALPRPGPLWILDEPFDALDDEGLALLEARLAAHRDAGGGLLFTSHRAPGPRLADGLHEVDLDALAPAAPSAPAVRSAPAEGPAP